MSHRPLIADHQGHALRRGPMVSVLGDTYWVCVTCHVFGIDFRNMERATDLPHWTDEDYYANKEWIDPDA